MTLSESGKRQCSKWSELFMSRCARISPLRVRVQPHFLLPDGPIRNFKVVLCLGPAAELVCTQANHEMNHGGWVGDGDSEYTDSLLRYHEQTRSSLT
jgi:hypothetical protein